TSRKSTRWPPHVSWWGPCRYQPSRFRRRRMGQPTKARRRRRPSERRRRTMTQRPEHGEPGGVGGAGESADAARTAQSAHGADSSARPPSQRRPLPRPLGQEERQRLLWEDPAGSTPVEMRDLAILAILLDTGLRGADLCALTLDAVRDEACTTLLVQDAK